MNIIDAHQHFWKYDAVNYAWISDDMQIIQRDFLPAHLAAIYATEQVNGCVAVEADQSELETERLLKYAAENNYIKGVVGYVDLRSAHLEDRLRHFSSFEKLKGFRYVLQGEEPDFMLQPAFLKGIGLLGKWGFTYDLLITPKHLDASLQLVQQFPEQLFVVDHIAKPYIKDGKMETWKTGMKKLAQLQNVYCKISGIVTEADWENWTVAELKPYLDVVVESFGSKRIMFGSDWPVCLLASSYNKWLQTVKDYFGSFSKEEQENIFSNNASEFYNL